MVWLRCTSSCSRLLRQHEGVRYASSMSTVQKSKESKPKRKWNRRRDFIDSMRIYVRAGGGGQGLPQYGGLGGNGGDVYVTAKKKLTLKHVLDKNPSKRFIAGPGDNSRQRKLVGNAGKDCVVEVPVGIAVCNEAGRVIGDLNEEKQSVRVARGGSGGTPDNSFLGQKGETTTVRLDLKLLADIGLVGFPNAGKSTFLSAISRASPKIASYPFTTVQPQIGVMQFSDHRQISVADLPGLIEGAHVNVGMGHRFLKHVERTKMLLFIVDVSGFQLPRREHFRSALETVLLLNKELELYRPELLTKPAVLAVNKMDTQSDTAAVDNIKNRLANIPDSLAGLDESVIPEQFVKFDHIAAISAKSGDSVADLKLKLRQILDFYADKQMYASHHGQKLIEVGEDFVSDLDNLEHNRVRPV